jgi:hypothetical protein
MVFNSTEGQRFVIWALLGETAAANMGAFGG